MSETRRERARKILSQSKELYTFLNCDDEFEQAIADMDKMDKIEKIISDISDYEYEDCEFDIRMIEKIVKGE